MSKHRAPRRKTGERGYQGKHRQPWEGTMPGKPSLPKHGKCYTCAGTGTVVEHYQDPKTGKWHAKTRTCPDCKGTGER